ncbi:hypothetical protein ACJQWK_08537 [Exserohilum turcicum]|uniref:Uncharacterized protein n=1 Tax=Exserohilum turcicum (strain 28A) TaxID=671987 RepID=R0KCQ7_EXST2|nr:uncharacterized protein SETTUDRAFT_19645 [Exserohilum turcica Et28A]EOA87129.1 hypothetical protein SETTUDRAFT_19645 [Exserohilum turcica Et28A]
MPRSEKASKVSQLVDFYQNTATPSAPIPKKPTRKTLAIEPGPSPEADLVKDTPNLQELPKASIYDFDGDSTAVPSSVSSPQTPVRMRSTSSSASRDNTISLPITVTLPTEADRKDYRVEVIGFTRVSVYSDDAPAEGFGSIISHPYTPFCMEQTSRTLSRSTSAQTSSGLTPDENRHLLNKMTSERQLVRPAPEEQMNHTIHSAYGLVCPVGWRSFKGDNSDTQCSHSMCSHAMSEARHESLAQDHIPAFTQIIMAQRNLQRYAKVSQSAQSVVDDVIGPDWVLGDEGQKTPVTRSMTCQDIPRDRRNSLDTLQSVGLKDKLRRVGRKFRGSGTNGKSTSQD